MNKSTIVAAFCFILITPYSANAQDMSNKIDLIPTIAILDAAVDTSIPSIKNKIVYEACLIQLPSCPNGLSEMQGAGSASIDHQWVFKNKFDHGTKMVSIATKINPDIKIVFVRIIGINNDGSRQKAGESTVYNALDWVIRNKDRFNIQAVAMSQGSSSNISSTEYCPKTPITESKIEELNNYNIPVFFPTGNGNNHNRIDWPACISQSIAVGAVSSNGVPESYSNYDPRLIDFFSEGRSKALTIDGKVISAYGTSVANVVAASNWVKIKLAKPNLSYNQLYDLIYRTSRPVSNLHIKNGKLINVKGAING